MKNIFTHWSTFVFQARDTAYASLHPSCKETLLKIIIYGLCKKNELSLSRHALSGWSFEAPAAGLNSVRALSEEMKLPLHGPRTAQLDGLKTFSSLAALRHGI